ncbi:MAG: sialidase family protein [Planctomycetota bacterium]
MRTTMGATMRTVAVAGAVAIVALAGRQGTAAEASPDVKLLYGFEPEEIVGQAGQDPTGKSKDWKFVGKVWTEDDVKSGWRVKDHLDVLRLPADHDGPVSIYVHDGSQDRSEITLYRTGATQGRYAMRGSPNLNWGWVKSVVDGKGEGGAGSGPGPGSYHTVREHFFGRECNIMDDALANCRSRRDWSGYDRLRIDVYSQGAPVVLGMRVQDASGPKSRKGYHAGLRTDLAVFNVPREKQVTLDFPMADMARVAEMDLSKAMGFLIQVNDYKGNAEMFLDNIRLVTKGAAEKDVRHPLMKMEGEIQPFKRKVVYNPTRRFEEKMERKTGPVEKVGPVDIAFAPWAHGDAGHFGGNGCVYSQNRIRGCAAYDNDRLCFLFGGSDEKRYQGMFAAASFDGGKTWGGLKPGEKEAVLLKTWHGRATGSSDSTGDIYLVGTENCMSYHEGYDTFFRRLAFTGEGWEDDRVSMIDQNMRKCPGTSHAWRLASGRIWATWCHSDAAPECTMAKYSDDDGYTWAPSKDASVTELPRPFYEANLEDLKKPVAERPKPPEAVLLWPSTPVPGAILLPYGDGEGVAVLGFKEWQVHDGKAWGPRRNVGLPGNGSTATVVGKDRIFMATGGGYNEKRGPLVVADGKAGGDWVRQTLETGDVGDVILSASGEAVFCFYVKVVTKDGAEVANEVRYRRWKDGAWGESEMVAREDFRINHLAAPIISPPNYAAVWWDERMLGGAAGRAKPLALRFMRIPNQ